MDSCNALIGLAQFGTVSTLRIDNSGRSVIYTFDHNSETVLVIICYIQNKREYLFLIEVSL